MSGWNSVNEGSLPVRAADRDRFAIAKSETQNSWRMKKIEITNLET
jgi:hypothetical protein